MTKLFEFQSVGLLGTSKGVKGGIKFVGDVRVFALLLELGVVFIRMKDGSPVPFHIIDVEEKGDYILYFQGIEDPQAAKSLTNCDVLVEREVYEQELQTNEGREALEYAYLTGYLLKDKTSNFQSRIEKVDQYPQQQMLVLESGHLVPVTQEFILQIDKNTREIVMELPHGLFEE